MPDKVKYIKAAIEESGIEDLEIEASGTISQAIGDLVDNETQILIADMKIPNKHGEDPIDDGGLRLINKILNNKKIIPLVRMILLTSVDSIYENYKNDKLKTHYDLIYFDMSSEEWKKKIINAIQTTKDYIASKNRGIITKKYNYDIAIITVNPRENKALEEMGEWKQIEIVNDATKYDETEWITNDGRILKVVKTSPLIMGMVPAAVASMNLINHFTPRFIVMPGVAACLEDEYKIGDVLIGIAVYNYSAGKYFSPKGNEQEAKDHPLNFWKPDTDVIETDADIDSIAQYDFTPQMDEIYTKWNEEHKGNRHYHPKNKPEVHGGIYACGTAVVQNEVIQEIMITNHKRKAAGLDMESYGMYYAARYCPQPRPIPIVLKSFSDRGDSSKNASKKPQGNNKKGTNKKSDDDKRQEYAAFVSVNFMKAFISETLINKYDQT